MKFLPSAAWISVAVPLFGAVSIAAEPSGTTESLLHKVREQTRRLDAREREIDARERAVSDLETEALRILEEVREVRQIVEQRLDDLDETKGDRVARLAKVYSEIPADRAAPLLEALGQDLATEVLARMKPKDSAGVLALMTDPSALRLSRAVARPLSPQRPPQGDAR